MKRTTLLLVLFFIFFTSQNSFAQNNLLLLKQYRSQKDEDKINFCKNIGTTSLEEIWPYVKSDFLELRKKFNEEKNTEILNVLIYFEGKINYNKKKFHLSIPLLKEAISKGKGLDLKDSIIAYSEMASGYLNLKNFEKAFECCKLTSLLHKRIPDLNPWDLKTNTSILYLEIGLYEKAIAERKEEFKNTPAKYKTQYLIANHLNNIGVFYNRWHKSDSALSYFNAARKMVVAYSKKDTGNIKNKFFLSLIEGNIAQAYMNVQNYEKAVPLLIKDIYWSKLSGNFDNVPISYNELALCYIKLKKYALAQTSLDSAKVYIEDNEVLTTLLYNRKLQAELHSLNNHKEEAMEEYKAYIILKDSLSSLDKERQLINEQITFEVKQKEDQIEQQMNELKADHELNSKRNYQFKLLLAGIGFLLISILFIAFNLKTVRKQKNELEIKNSKIETQKKLIELSLKEKDALFKEVHHRVKNNLQIVTSLLNLQSNKTDNPETISLLNESKQRIVSIALTHEFLYKSHEILVIQMKDYLLGLTNQIKTLNASSDRDIKLIFEVENILLHIDTALPIGLIVNELVSNAYKHAFENKTEGVIKLKFFALPDKSFKLEISDNGKGIPSEVLNSKNYNMGLELVEILSEQLNAELTIDNKTGSHFTFIFTKSL